MNGRFRKIGQILAAARKEQKKTLKEASESTKITEKYLEAVEANNISQLPSDAYFILFARSYAQYLGIDPAILEEIESNNFDEVETGSDNGRRIQETPHDQAKIFGRNLMFLILGIIGIFILVLIYNLLIADNNDELDEKSAAPVNSTEIESETSAANKDNESDPIVTPYVPPEMLTLELQAKQDVWIQVVRDGDTVFNRQLNAGEKRRWEAKYRYVLTLGISTAVDLTLNGVKLAPFATNARTITGLEINQVNYKQFYPPEAQETKQRSDGSPDITPTSTANKGSAHYGG